MLDNLKGYCIDMRAVDKNISSEQRCFGRIIIFKLKIVE